MPLLLCTNKTLNKVSTKLNDYLGINYVFLIKESVIYLYLAPACIKPILTNRRIFNTCSRLSAKYAESYGTVHPINTCKYTDTLR